MGRLGAERELGGNTPEGQGSPQVGEWPLAKTKRRGRPWEPLEMIMLSAQCTNAGCGPRTPLSWGRAGPRQRAHLARPGARGCLQQPQQLHTSSLAGNHSLQDPSKEGSGCFVALSSLGLCSSPPREARAVGASCKISLIQPFLLAPRPASEDQPSCHCGWQQ